MIARAHFGQADSLHPKLTMRHSLLLLLLLLLPLSLHADEAIRVVVWDEQQPAQQKAYENFLGNAIAEHLEKQPGLAVRSMKQDDAEQGLADVVLDNCDVLIWWGHARQREIKVETGVQIARRIKEGKLSLIALHSAHWSTPFMEAMNERAIADALAKLPAEQRAKVRVDARRPTRFAVPKRDDPRTPSSELRTDPDGSQVLVVQLPTCIFPAYRADGQPSHVVTKLRDHPIARGLPEEFDIPQTEMYDEPFHIPEPDAVVFTESWDKGETFRSGCVWNVGKGKVFYFRPGHETYPVYKQAETLKIMENAVRWMGKPS